MSDGQYLTLNSMIKKRAPDYTFRKYHDKSRYTYYFNFCSPTIMTCNGEEDAMAIQMIEGDCISVLARGKASYVEYIDETSPRKGVVVTFDGGDSCEYGYRKVKHILKWDKEIGYEIEDIDESDSCTYTVTWRTKYTCNFSAKSKDLYIREREEQEIQTIFINRNKSLWDNTIVKVVFFSIIAFLLLNCCLFYQNLKRDPYRNYSRAIPFRDQYKQVYRMVRSKF